MAGGLGHAYNQTDVWHDRAWLMQNLLSHDRRLRKASEIALNQLNVDEAMGQREQALGLREAVAMEGLDQRQMHFEAEHRRKLAHDASMESYKQLTHDRDTEIDEQGHLMLHNMLKLDGALRKREITKDQYDTALLDLGQQLPLAMRHPEAAKHYEFAVTEADRQNNFNLRRTFAEATKLGAKYGIGVHADPETGLPSIEHTRQAALQTEKGKSEVLKGLNDEMMQKYGLGTGVSSLFNPVAPHTSPDEGKTIDIPFINHAGETGKVNVPMPLFDQMKSDFNDRYFAVAPKQQPAMQPGAQPTTEATAPAAAPSIEVGTQRTINGVQAVWDGKGWKRAQ